MNNQLPAARIPWLDYLFVVAIVIIYAFGYTFNTIVLDTARDYMQMQRILSGEQWVMQGPTLAARYHFGPIWFYWLAIAGIWQSLPLVAWWVGVSAAMKFPLAYYLGYQLGGRVLAIAMVFALTLPGWQGLEQLSFSHTNMVATLSLGFVCLAVKVYQKQHYHYFPYLALLYSLALHAHPSTWGLVLPVLPWVASLLLRGQLRWQWIFLSIFLFLLPFVPYLIFQSQHDWPDWQIKSTGDNVALAGLFSWQYLQRLPALFAVLFVDGPRLMMQVTENGTGLTAIFSVWFLRMTYVISVAMASLGLIMWIRRQWCDGVAEGGKRALIAIAIAVAMAAAVLVLRSNVTFYMLYALQPVVALFIAFGLYCWLKFVPVSFYQRFVLPKLMLFALILLAININSWRAMIHKTGTLLPTHFVMNVFSDYPAVNWQAQAMQMNDMVVNQADGLGKILCQQHRPLHGPIVTDLDITFGVAVLFHCPLSSLQVDSANHQSERPAYTLLSAVMAEALRREGLTLPAAEKGWVMLSPVTPLKPVSHQWPQLKTYPPRTFVLPGQERFTIKATLPARQLLIVSNYLSYYQPVKSIEIRVNQQTLQPLASNDYTEIYYCHTCQAESEWTITVVGGQYDSIDIITVQLPRL